MEIIFAIGIVTFLMLYLAFQVDNKHFLLQFLLVMVAVFMLLLIPKAALDVEDNCGFVPMNSTQVGSVVSYEYDYICETSGYDTAGTFYKYTLWIVRLIMTYIVFYFIFTVINWLAKNGKNKQE